MKTIPIIKEVCVESLEQAMIAEDLGADRIELCSKLIFDGLTPSRNLIIKVNRSLSIPVKIMIRPRKGDFIYNDFEINQLESDIIFCKENGIKEVVFGVLDDNRKIDIEKVKKLAHSSYPMKITFHKAIDQTSNIINELGRLEKIEGITSVLTSGGVQYILDEKSQIKDIMNNFGKKFNIILAGGITDKNLNEVKNKFEAYEFHGKKIVGDLKKI